MEASKKKNITANGQSINGIHSKDISEHILVEHPKSIFNSSLR